MSTTTVRDTKITKADEMAAEALNALEEFAKKPLPNGHLNVSAAIEEAHVRGALLKLSREQIIADPIVKDALKLCGQDYWSPPKSTPKAIGFLEFFKGDKKVTKKLTKKGMQALCAYLDITVESVPKTEDMAIAVMTEYLNDTVRIKLDACFECMSKMAPSKKGSVNSRDYESLYSLLKNHKLDDTADSGKTEPIMQNTENVSILHPGKTQGFALDDEAEAEGEGETVYMDDVDTSPVGHQ